VLLLPRRPRVLRRRRGRHRHRPQRQQGPQEPLRVILNGLGKDAAQIISRINGFTYVQTQFDYYTGELKSCARSAYSEGERAEVRCYGADDVREGVAIMHNEGVDVSITGNSTNPTRFQHPVAGTYKKGASSRARSTSPWPPAAARAARCIRTTWAPAPLPTA
jgi:hypothetical protein